MKKRKWILVSFIIIVVISGWFAYQKFGNKPNELPTTNKEKSKSKASGKKLSVNAIVLKPVSVVDRFNTNSTLLPSEEVDLAFETSGIITKIYFTEGTLVKKGTLLAKLRDALLQAQLQKALSEQKLYESKAYRQKALLAQDAISQEAYDQVVTMVESGKADIALLQARIRETELRAPFDGVLGLREVSEGAYVTPSSRITHISMISSLKIEFSVPERYSDIVKKGTPITFRLSGDTTVYKASVYATESKVDADTRTLQMRAIYPNANKTITPGRFATVSLQLSEEKEGMMVPSEAVIPEMGKQTVFVANNGKAVKKEIIPGLRTEEMVQVLGGLNFGDTVLTTGILQLRQGLSINIENIARQTN